jgi:inosine-uridine nucleoside N-ribohydrolase
VVQLVLLRGLDGVAGVGLAGDRAARGDLGFERQIARLAQRQLDDVGALAVLLNAEKAGVCEIAAVTHCTSNPYGAGCIDAICTYMGRTDMKIGTLKRPGVLHGPECRVYNEFIAKNYKNRYPEGEGVEDAVRVIRRAMVDYDEILLISIGPYGNISDFLDSGADDISPLSGVELARKKAPLLVSMAGRLKGGNREFNIFVEPGASANVMEKWPGRIVFSLFETGDDILTGADINNKLGEEHPAAKAYTLYCHEQGHASFDLTAVVWALYPDIGLFRESENGFMSVNGDDGTNAWAPCENGRHIYFEKAVSPKAAAEKIYTLMLK